MFQRRKSKADPPPPPPPPPTTTATITTNVKKRDAELPSPVMTFNAAKKTKEVQTKTEQNTDKK